MRKLTQEEFGDLISQYSIDLYNARNEGSLEKVRINLYNNYLKLSK